jgi:hypothetical protein
MQTRRFFTTSFFSMSSIASFLFRRQARTIIANDQFGITATAKRATMTNMITAQDPPPHGLILVTVSITMTTVRLYSLELLSMKVQSRLTLDLADFNGYRNRYREDG